MILMPVLSLEQLHGGVAQSVNGRLEDMNGSALAGNGEGVVLVAAGQLPFVVPNGSPDIAIAGNLFYHHLLESGVDTDHIIRFAFDSADDLHLIGESLIQMNKEKRGADPEKFTAYIRAKVADDGMYYLLLDEIQMLDCFEAVLNGYLRKENMDIFVTGSNAKLLSKDIATEFAGRGDEIHMYPLSFSEFMSVYHGDKYAGLSEYMLYGGIPLVVLRDDAGDKAAALENLFSEIYIRDICRRNRVRNVGELEDLLSPG